MSIVVSEHKVSLGCPEITENIETQLCCFLVIHAKIPQFIATNW